MRRQTYRPVESSARMVRMEGQPAAEAASVSTGNPNTALVLFSGGQDSTVCLAWALQRFARVETIGFEYGQRHMVEMTVRPRVRARLGALSASWAGRLGEDHVVKLDALAAMSDTAL